MHNRIMTAAVEEMSERGIKFTMSDLARSLGVSKRCLYEHFASKEQLISSIVDVLLEDVQEQRTAILANKDLNFQDKLRAILCVNPKVFSPTEGRMADEIKRFMPAEWDRIERFMERHWVFLEGFFNDGIAKGEFRPVCLPILQKMLKGCMNEMVDYRFLVQHGISLTEAKSCVVDILTYGMATR